MLIEVSGIDGSGKSTLIRRLRHRLNRDGDLVAYERVLRDRGRLVLEDIARQEGKRSDEIFDAFSVELVSALERLDEANRHFGYLRPNSRQLYFVAPYHATWLAKAHSKSPAFSSQLQRVYERLPRPDLSVVLELTPGGALDRVRSREAGDNFLREADPLGTLARRADGLEAVRSLLPYEQVALDATLSPPQLTSIVEASILERLDR